MQRIVIAGGPRCGKTTLAASLASKLGFPVRHTDDLIGKCEWSVAYVQVASWFSTPAPWIVEGVTAVHALRKWLEFHRLGKPCDRVVFLRAPVTATTEKQRAMLKGCETVWSEVLGPLVQRGVKLGVVEHHGT